MTDAKTIELALRRLARRPGAINGLLNTELFYALANEIGEFDRHDFRQIEADELEALRKL